MWTLFLARKHLFPPGRFPVFAVISVLGVALGIAALLIVQTVMFSFGEEHRRRIRESSGDIVVSAGGRRIGNISEMCALLGKQPGVAAAAAYIDGAAILETPAGGLQFLPSVRGIDPLAETGIVPLKKYLDDGSGGDTNADAVLEAFDDGRVILGRRLAQNLRARVGGRVTLYSPFKLRQMLDSGGARGSMPKELEVCGILNTGFKQLDDGLVLVTLSTARDLFGYASGEAAAVHLKLNDHRATDDIIKNLRETERFPPPFHIRPWTETNDEIIHFLNAIDAEKGTLFLLMFIILLVASFSIGSTLFNHVVRRAREIGLLGALGAPPRAILGLFLAQGLAVGVIGYAAGVGLTFLILHFRQEIIEFMGQGDLLANQYQFTRVPLYYNPADFYKAALLTLFLMFLVSLLPALWAARRKPTEAMRDAS